MITGGPRKGLARFFGGSNMHTALRNVLAFGLYAFAILCGNGLVSKAHAQSDFSSMAESSLNIATNIAAVEAMNGTLAQSFYPNAGPSQAQKLARDRYNAERERCLKNVIAVTDGGSYARKAGRARCKSQYPVRYARDFPDASSTRYASRAPIHNLAAPSAAVSGAYRVSPAVAAEVREELYQSLAKISRSQADEIRRALFNQDIERLFDDTVRPFGLSAGNVIDATTAFWVSMWVISHQAPNPSVQQIAQARQQVLKVLAHEGTLNASDADKQRIAQGMMFETIIALVAFNNAQIDKRQLANATTNNLLRRGLDMRQLVLTSRGFEPR
jgi:hypothetical protein